MKYSEMSIDKPILKALEEMGFEEPTDIQMKAIPLIKEGKDVIGQSETGSGKTAAFGVPILEKIVAGESVQCLVIAPTRELAEQISKNFKEYSKHKPLHIALVYGGVGYENQIHNMRKADIVVGTPGRLLDHLRNGQLCLDTVKFVVLDEADKMFEMGFIEDIAQILNYTPQKKQMLLFSATMSSEVQRIAEGYMNHPHLIKTKEYVEKALLKQVFYDVGRVNKFSLLVHLIKTESPHAAIVFCSTRREVDFVSRNLKINGINAMPLHGGLSQTMRNKVMDSFRDKTTHILVASDVAARGIDIKDLTHIFNYGIPKTPKEYVHRVGRTARMGNSGIAISLLAEMDYENFNKVLSDHTIQVEQLPLPEFKRIEITRSFAGRGGFGGRESGDRRFGNYQSRDRPRYGGGSNYRPRFGGRY